MAICSACGTANADGARFCMKCGAAVGATGTATAAAAPPKPQTSSLAIAALIFAIIPGCQLVGIILGIIAIVRINSRPNELSGMGIAIASLVVPFVVIFVVGILSAIAIPSFIRYKSRAMQTEAKMSLRQIYVAEQSYEVDHNKPASTFAEIGFQPEDKRHYAYFMGDDSLPLPASTYAIPPSLRSETEAPDVLAVAVGNIDSDSTLDVWVVTKTGQVRNVQDDATE